MNLKTSMTMMVITFFSQIFSGPYETLRIDRLYQLHGENIRFELRRYIKNDVDRDILYAMTFLNRDSFRKAIEFYQSKIEADPGILGINYAKSMAESDLDRLRSWFNKYAIDQNFAGITYESRSFDIDLTDCFLNQFRNETQGLVNRRSLIDKAWQEVQESNQRLNAERAEDNARSAADSVRGKDRDSRIKLENQHVCSRNDLELQEVFARRELECAELACKSQYEKTKIRKRFGLATLGRLSAGCLSAGMIFYFYKKLKVRKTRKKN